MGEEIVWKWSKMVEFPTFVGSCPWPLPWIRAWSLLFFISHQVLPVYQISSKSKKLFVDGQTYGHTDVRTDGNLPPIVLGRLPEFGSRPKNASCDRDHTLLGVFCHAKAVNWYSLHACKLWWSARSKKETPDKKLKAAVYMQHHSAESHLESVLRCTNVNVSDMPPHTWTEVLSWKIVQAVHEYRGNNIWPDEQMNKKWMNGTMVQPK